MKKVLILILAMVLSFSVFALAACQTPCETHVDANHDGICDVCATENLPVVHADSNHDGKCDVCAADYREACADVNPLDGKCDVCGAAVAHTCVDTATVDGKCDICGADVAHTHVDAMHDGKCDICGTTVEVKHVDNNHDGVCDVCQAGDLPYEHVDADTNFKCDVCGKVLEHDCVDANTDCWCDVCEAAMHADNNHDGFCDVCDTSTGEPEHVYVEGVCSCGAKEEWLVTLEAAQDFLRASYIEEPTRTAGDFKVLAQVPAGEGFLPVTWTVELVSGGNADSVKVGATEGTETTIEIDEEQMDVYYKLIGTVTDSEGRKLSVSFDRELPNYNLVNWKDYVAAPKDYTLSVQGVVTALTGKSVGNTYNTIYIQDNDGGYYIYDMASDPVADGIKVGMTIKVRGTKDIYSGTHEVKEAVAEIVDQTIKTIEPVDYTTIYTNAQSLKAEDLVAKQGFLVTIKGVQITGQNLENGYFKFKLGDLESYIRISGSVCPLSKDEQTKFKADHSSHFGWTANATGVICVYDGAFYLTPVNANAFEYTALPELDEAGEVAFEKGALTFIETIGEDSAIELPAKGVSYADVTIAWDFKAETAHDCASIADGKLHVELPSEATTITLVATLTSGSVTDTKEFVVAVDAASTAVVVHKAISAPAAGTYKIAMNTTPANGAVLYFAGTLNSKGALETTDKAEKAVDVVVEVLDATAGTYSLKVGDQYLEGYLNGTYKNIRFSKTAAAWTWNDEAKVFVCDIDGVKYYFGDRDRGGYANTTMALSDIKYITGENLSKVGVSQFPGLMGTLAPAAYAAAPISAPAAGTYKIAMNTTPANGAVLYFAGTINSKGALETTDKAEKAVDVVVEVLDATAGTYSLKVGDQYLEGYLNGTYKNIRFSKTAAAWTWNDEAKVFVCDIDGVKYYFGDRDRGGYANTTMALSDIKYITGENLSKVGVSQFPGLLSNLVVKEVELVAISAPAAGTYKIAMNTTPANGAVLYFAGTINSKGALETTDKAEKAVDVVVEVLDATAGTYSLKVGDQYLEGYLNGTYKNIRFSKTAAAWTWNDEAKVFVCDIDGVKYYFGDRDRGGYANTTMALSDIKYITGENLSKVGVSQFPGQLGSWQFVQEGGSDVPAHTCESVCEICKGCLDAECTEEACATKCSCVETEAPAAGTYVVEMYQSKKKINVYLTGEVSGHYLATSESSNDAMTVTLAKLENGKYTIQLSNGKYLAMVASGKYINAVMQETACEFTWNAKLGNFTVAFDGTEYFFGTYDDFTTIGTCKLSYASTNYQAKLVAPLAHSCDSACENCGGCLDSECTEEACTTKCSCPVAGQNGEYTLTIPAKGKTWTATELVNDIFYATNKAKTESIKLEGAAYEADGLVFESSQLSLTGGGVKVSDGLVCNAIGFAVGKGQQATVVVYGALKSDKSGVTFVVMNPAMEAVEVSGLKINGVDAEAFDALAIDAVKKYEFTLGEGIYYFGGSGGGAYVYGMSITLADAPAGEAVTTKIDLVTNFATYASGWDTSYTERVIDVSAVSTLTGTLTLSRANKQSQTITDRPVMATGKGTTVTYAILVLDDNISAVTFDLKQWGTKTFKGIHIEYYDATTSTWVSCSSSITAPAAISSTEIPAGVTQVRLVIENSADSNVQVGLTAIEVTTK